MYIRLSGLRLVLISGEHRSVIGAQINSCARECIILASGNLLCPRNYRDGYYAQSFVTTVIIWQDNELVNNVIPFARRVRVANGAASGDNSSVRCRGRVAECCVQSLLGVASFDYRSAASFATSTNTSAFARNLAAPGNSVR